MFINNTNEMYNYKYSNRCTLVWLIPTVDAELTVASTIPLRSGIDDSTSWCCKHEKITLWKTSCEMNSKLTSNYHWKCVHYRGMSMLILMHTCPGQGRGSSGANNPLIYVWTMGRSKPKRRCRDWWWCLNSWSVTIVRHGAELME